MAASSRRLRRRCRTERGLFTLPATGAPRYHPRHNDARPHGRFAGPDHHGGNVELSDYPCESLTFSGLGATGSSPQAAATRLATALNNWVARNRGRRLLQVTPVAVPAGDEAGLAALLVHTAGTELTGQLADEVAAVVDDALEQADAVESRAATERKSPARQAVGDSGF